MSRGWSQSMQTSVGCPEHVSPGHRSCPQMPPRLLGWLLLQLLHLQGGWGHCGATVCRSPGAARSHCGATVGSCCGATVCRSPGVQHVLFEDPPWGLPHLPLQDPALASNPPKAAGGTPSPPPAADRGWGGPALPSPGLLGTECRRHRRPELLQAGGDLEALHPCGCSLVLRVPASLGVPKSGVPQDLEPWGLELPQSPFLNLKLEVL